jgi:hypothetical protein
MNRRKFFGLFAAAPAALVVAPTPKGTDTRVTIEAMMRESASLIESWPRSEPIFRIPPDEIEFGKFTAMDFGEIWTGNNLNSLMPLGEWAKRTGQTR